MALRFIDFEEKRLTGCAWRQSNLRNNMMRLSRALGAAAIVCVLFASASFGQNMQDDSNKIADLIKQFDNQSFNDNPLVPYETAAQIRLNLCPEPDDATGFWQSYANFGPFIGDITGTMQAFARVRSKPPAHDGPLLKSVLDDYQAIDAVSYVAERAAKHQFVMLGEEHMDPQSRSLLVPMLRVLHSLGYRYFAAETFNGSLDSTIKAGHTVMETGFYTRDPVFAEAVNEAIKLGYTLVSYESTDEPEEIKKAGEPKRSNFREMRQAKNLQERILNKDPNAKVLVWAGRGHVYLDLLESQRVQNQDEVWQPMAYLFSKLTGQQPLSLILCQQLETQNPDKETMEYKYAAARGWLKHPTVFVKHDSPYNERGAAHVFFPRQKFSNGRVDWLATEIGRVEYPIPQKVLFQKGIQLVRAYVEGQSKQSVPVDCVLIHENEPAPPMMLPRHGKFVLRATDSQGRTNGDAVVETN